MKKKRMSPRMVAGISVAYVAILALVIAALLYYLVRMDERRAEYEAGVSLEQSAEQRSRLAGVALDERFSMLEAVAAYVGENPGQNAEFYAGVFDAAMEADGFTGLYTTSPTAADADSQIIERALAGSRAISMPGEAGALLAVPIYDAEGNVTGALCGGLDVAAISSVVMSTMADMGNPVMLLDDDGSCLVALKNGEAEYVGAPLAERSFEEDSELISEMLAALSDGRPFVTAAAAARGSRVFVVQTPFKYNGWSLACIVDVDAAIVGAGWRAGTIYLLVAASVILMSVLLLLLLRDRRRLRDEAISLSLSEERYRLVAKDTNVVVYEIDLRAMTLTANENYARFFGEEADYTRFVAGTLVAPEDIDSFKKLLSTAIQGQGGEVELRMRRGKEEYQWYRLSMSAPHGDDDRPLRIFGQIADIDKRKRELELLELKSQTDQMTGLYNKTAAEELARRGLAETCGVNAMLVADMDGLKQINDRMGHTCGDAAIRAVATTIREHFRRTDIVGRVGGDEFMAFLYDIGSKERLRDMVSSLARKLASLKLDNGQPARASIGAALCPPEGCGYEELFGMADTALYHVKRTGKNGYAIYTPDMERGSFELEENAAVSLRQIDRFDSPEIRRLLYAISEIYPFIAAANLTRNTYSLLQYSADNSAIGLASEFGVYDDLIDVTAESLVEQDREGFRTAFSRDRLLDAYALSRVSVQLEGCRPGDKWQYFMAAFTQSDAGDVMCVLMSHPVSPAREAELKNSALQDFVGKAVMSGFEYICLIHSLTGRYDLYSESERNSHRVEPQGDFDAAVRSIRDHQIPESDRETFYEAACMRNVVRRVAENGGRYSYAYRVCMDNGFAAYEASCSYCEPTRTELLMTVRRLS